MYEYKRINYGILSTVRPEQFFEELNKFGQQGWDLVSYQENKTESDSFYKFTAVLKRPIGGKTLNPKILDKLRQNALFIQSFKPYDFNKNMGQFGVELTYTDDNKQVLTTKSTLKNVHSSYEFDSDSEFFEFIEFLKQSGIPRTL